MAAIVVHAEQGILTEWHVLAQFQIFSWQIPCRNFRSVRQPLLVNIHVQADKAIIQDVVLVLAQVWNRARNKLTHPR